MEIVISHFIFPSFSTARRLSDGEAPEAQA